MLRFRPHHFLCALGFQGKGYSPEFVDGFQGVVDRLRSPSGEAEEVEVTGGADTICGPCPHRRGDGCETDAKIRSLDRAHGQVLGLKPGDRLTWGEARDRIAEKFTVTAHRRACASCSWRELGVCEKALLDLKREKRGRSDRRAEALLALWVALGLGLAQAVIPAAHATVPEAGEQPVEPPVSSPKSEDSGVIAPDASRLPTPTTSNGVPISSGLPPKNYRSAPVSEAPNKSTQVTPWAGGGGEPETASPLSQSGGSVMATGPIEDGSKFVDEITSKIRRGRKSLTAELIRQAYDHMAHERFTPALTLAARISRDPLFADYGVMLAGRAFLRRAAFKSGQRGVRPADAATDATEAIQRFSQISLQYPESPFAGDAAHGIALSELVLGQSLANRSKWREAQAAYERAFDRLIPTGRLLRSGREHIETYAKACSRAKNRNCFAWCWRLVDNIPKDSQEAAAIARYVPDAVSLKDKAELADRLTATYYGDFKDDDAFDEAFDLYMRREYGEAVAHFKAFLDEYPKSVYRHRARYWLARSYERNGDREKARTMHEVLLSEAPLTFYGILSAMALGKTPVSYVDATLPTVVTEDPYLYPSEIRRLDRAEKLIAAGATSAAFEELKGFEARRVHGNKFLMYLAMLDHQAGDYLDSFKILGELFNRGYEGVNSSHTLRLIFPIVYESLIQRNADVNRIDPILILSLMKQESAFDPTAVSHAGAIGLMQLMPVTAVDNDPKLELAQLTDGEANVRVGTSYIARILRQFNGNIVFTLAGYNGGPGRVRKWKRDFADRYHRDPDMLEFMELIPYKETREYVGSIIRNYYWYSYRLNGTLLTSLDYFWGVSGPLSHPIRLSVDLDRPPASGSRPKEDAQIAGHVTF
ncbi:MAG TPA: DUF1284 domain-containing protein [Bdellovibrionota bacterium]|nr:DUF1284 domain-containing protein [Bdellovibrionota bacterium]